MNELTSIQEQCLLAIIGYMKANEKPPARRELKQILGQKSTNGVNQIVKALVKKGYIKIDPPGGKGTLLCCIPHQSNSPFTKIWRREPPLRAWPRIIIWNWSLPSFRRNTFPTLWWASRTPVANCSSTQNRMGLGSWPISRRDNRLMGTLVKN